MKAYSLTYPCPTAALHDCEPPSFFESRKSRSASLSKLRSATSFFNGAFSSRNCFTSCACTHVPSAMLRFPSVDRAPWTPRSRATSSMPRPRLTCFRTAMISRLCRGTRSGHASPPFLYPKSYSVLCGFGEQVSLGRTIQSRTTVPTSTCSGNYAYVDTTYDNEGRKASVSNTYCTTGDSTYGVTTTRYDPLDRVCLVTPQDGTTVGGTACPTIPPTNDIFTTYSDSNSLHALCTTVSDQAGKSRKSCSDGLGRMEYVFEDPGSSNYETDYSYNALDDLTSVLQSSSRSRSFTYDSLSRPAASRQSLRSGTLNYTYDDNGNMSTKVAPQANQTGSSTTTTTYCYDTMNRITQKRYASGSCPFSSPDVSYTYSGSRMPVLEWVPCYNVGHRTGMSDTGGSEAWSYYYVSGVGDGIADQRTTNSVTKTFTYVKITTMALLRRSDTQVGAQLHMALT